MTHTAVGRWAGVAYCAWQRTDVMLPAAATETVDTTRPSDCHAGGLHECTPACRDHPCSSLYPLTDRPTASPLPASLHLRPAIARLTVRPSARPYALSTTALPDMQDNVDDFNASATARGCHPRRLRRPPCRQT